MVLDAVLTRFVEKTPLTVMAHARARSGPKPKMKKTYVSSHEATKHVATARVLRKGSI